ncbi:BglG family transcription antiterminator [Candidatus Enterococcus clewellii]|uniref:Uncharacterized protein n=1 Tax=Candidatus Enterococcus clewellii TaxID=1834193 RepID=A0A242K6I6_9ENTE|nr:PTS sugar transporter subunit IIA [Enterococcus sp. 9E7_DIV0242]OTP15920.1 hypothetical protein A5888_002134 [Enterococcus sp. 9E7_DIV0242]
MALNKREQALLQLLLDQTDFLPAAFFKNKLYVSAKTVYTDLARLEEKLTDTGLHISRLPRKGVRVEGTEAARKKATALLIEKTKKIDKFSPEYRKIFIFANYLFSEKPMHYQEFADYFYVSYQSIKKDVDEILEYCRKENVQGRMTDRGVVLDTTESVRQRVFKSMLDFFIESSSIDTKAIQSVFDENNVRLVTCFVSDLSVALDHQLNSYFVDSLKISLEILLGRVQKGAHIEPQKELVFDELKRMQLYMQGVAFSEMVAKEQRFQLTDEDIHYVCSLLLAHGIEPYLKMTANSQKMITVTKKMIVNMSDLLSIDLTDDELLMQALLSHVVPMIHRLKNHIAIKNPLRESIKKQYSTMFTLTKFVIGDLEKKYDVALTEDEVTFLTIHFQLAFEKIRVTKHILIVCNSGMATSELIFNRIKQNIAADVILEITSFDKLSHISLETVDLIISTIQLEETTTEVMYVSALPTPEEIGKISAYVSNLSEHKKSFHSKEYKNTHLLSKYLDRDFLYVKQEFKTKEAILTYLADDYQEKGLVTGDFKKTLFIREELGSTGLKTGVAIPHAEPETVNQTKLSFMALASPIKWGSSQIQLVVLLAIAEEDMAEAKELIASIYDLFNSPKEIKWVVDSQSKEELYQRLLRGGNGHVF